MSAGVLPRLPTGASRPIARIWALDRRTTTPTDPRRAVVATDRPAIGQLIDGKAVKLENEVAFNNRTT